MPEYEISTHLQCPGSSLGEILDHFGQALAKLGGDRSTVLSWLRQVDWPNNGSGFVSEGDAFRLSGNSGIDTPLIGAPYVFGYTPFSIPGLQPNWVQVSLIFDDTSETLEVMEGSEWKYRPRVGWAAFGVMREFVRFLGGSLVYFGDFSSSNQSWHALHGRDGNLWAFDCALVSPSLSARFEPLSAGYDREPLPEGIAFARRARWMSEPWAPSVPTS